MDFSYLLAAVVVGILIVIVMYFSTTEEEMKQNKTKLEKAPDLQKIYEQKEVAREQEYRNIIATLTRQEEQRQKLFHEEMMRIEDMKLQLNTERNKYAQSQPQPINVAPAKKRRRNAKKVTISQSQS